MKFQVIGAFLQVVRPLVRATPLIPEVVFCSRRSAQISTRRYDCWYEHPHLYQRPFSLLDSKGHQAQHNTSASMSLHARIKHRLLSLIR